MMCINSYAPVAGNEDLQVTPEMWVFMTGKVLLAA
jgi:hypothetical protein